MPQAAEPGLKSVPTPHILPPTAGRRAGDTPFSLPDHGPAKDVFHVTEGAMPKSDTVSSARVEQPVLIVFADLTRFMANSRSAGDAALAELLDGYYRHAEGLVAAAGGRVVKFMGDAFLAVWPEAGAGGGVEALPALKRDIDSWWGAKGWDSRVVFKAHFGSAVIGPFGADARFDVIGNEVNVAATLPARTVSLSAEAFRRLENGKRRAFRKHSAPVVYIPVDDPRP